jgi:hypothetical protein
MLIAVETVSFLRFGHPHPGLDIDIVIDARHIRIGMMDDIVFHIPHKAVTPQYVQRKSGQMIYPFIFGKTAMRTVMHNIETDGGYHPAQQHTFQDGPDGTGRKEHEMDIDKDETRHQDNGLQKKIIITRSGLAHLLKITADPPF